jgi:hypothetical protein
MRNRTSSFNMRISRPADDPVIMAHYKLPSDRGVLMQDGLVRSATEIASDRLRLALLRYGVRHGLPGLSSAECLRRLREEAAR